MSHTPRAVYATHQLRLHPELVCPARIYTGTHRLLACTCRRAEGEGLTREHSFERVEQGVSLLAGRREVAPHAAEASRASFGPQSPIIMILCVLALPTKSAKEATLESGEDFMVKFMGGADFRAKGHLRPQPNFKYR